MTEKRHVFALLAACGMFLVAVLSLAIWKWQVFAYNAVDFAYFAQAAWNSAHGRFFSLSIHPTSTLGDHAEWLLLPIAFLSRIIPHPLTLVFLQAAVIAASAAIVWRIAKKTLPPAWALGAGIAVLLLPSAGGMALFEFHPLVFALPALLLAAAAYRDQRFGRFALFLALALLVREDVALPVFFFGAIALVERRAARWVALPVVFSAAWFLVMLQTIRFFSVSGNYKFFAYYGWLWPLDVGALAQHLFTLPQLEFVLALFMPWLFLPLIRPKWLLLALPGYLQIVLASWGGGAALLGTHYVALILPGIIVAGIDGMTALLKYRVGAKQASPLQNWRSLIMDRRLLAIVLGVAVVFSAGMLGPFGRGTRIALAEPIPSAPGRAVALIPEGASVAASERFLPALAEREGLIALRYLFLGITQYGLTPYEPAAPEYLIYDEEDLLAWHASFPTLEWTAARYRPGFVRLRALIDQGGYGVVFRDGGVVVWRRGAERATVSGTVEESAALSTDVRLSVVDAPALCPGRSGPCPTLLIRAATPQPDDLLLRLTPADGGAPVLVTFGIVPTFDWQPGQTVVVPLSMLAKDATVELVSARGRLVLDALGRTVVEWMDVSSRSERVPISPAAYAAPAAPGAGTP